MTAEPLIHTLTAVPVSGDDIERRSFEHIDACLDRSDFERPARAVVRRLIHAGGDIGLGEAFVTSPGAVEAGTKALRDGAPIVVDARMIRAGLCLARLQRAFAAYRSWDVICHIADPDVAEASHRAGLPRSLFALRKARARLQGAVAVFGNSPVALMELNRLIMEEGICPAVVIGFPVGFIHVIEAKEELMRLDIPSIVLKGHRGGSPLAVAAIHALAGLAAESPVSQSSADPRGDRRPPDAVILLGHGSRVPNAGEALVKLAAALGARLEGTRIETCYLSRLGPHFPETFERLVEGGARRMVVLPYFLHTGLHIRLDIPEMLKRHATRHPEVALVLGEPIGFHDALVDIVEERIAESLGKPDIRNLPLPPRDAFPVPPGQDEFVPMPPALASRWRAGGVQDLSRVPQRRGGEGSHG